MSTAVENLHHPTDPNLKHALEQGIELDLEPLAQEVGLTVQRTDNPCHFIFTQRLQTPPIIAYTTEKKQEIEAKAPRYHSGFRHFRHNAADIFHGITRSLGAGQIATTKDGRLVLIGKTADDDANKITSFDLIAGASQQSGNINFLNTALREGNAEELVEIRDGKIVLSDGNKERAMGKAYENIEKFLELYKGTLPEPFDSTFNRILESKSDEFFIEIPYYSNPRIADKISNLPQGSVSVVNNGENIHTSTGSVVIHKKGGDVLFDRIVDPQFLIDLEIVPGEKKLLLNRPFLLATSNQCIALCNGEKVEVEMTQLGSHWHEKIQIDPKPLVHEFSRYLNNLNY